MRDLGPSAALLSWSAIPPANEVSRRSTTALEGGKRVFWDHADPELRRQMLQLGATRENLRAMLPALRLRLQEAGLHTHVQFYEDSEVSRILAAAASGAGDVLVRSLLFFESMLVEKGAEALGDIQKFHRTAATSPTKAVDRLAEFAADIATAFNKLAGNSVFGGVSFRAVSQAVFADAARALDPGVAPEPRALLTLSVLKPEAGRTFTMKAFLEGAVPPPDEVLVSQHLVSG